MMKLVVFQVSKGRVKGEFIMFIYGELLAIHIKNP